MLILCVEEQKSKGTNGKSPTSYQEKAAPVQDDKEDSRNSLIMEVEQYDEIDMGENKDLKIPDMQAIEEEVNEDLDNHDPKNDALDSFIVNQAYFGEHEEDKMMELSIDRITQIAKKANNNDVSNLLSPDEDGGNDTMSDLVQTLSNPNGKIGKTGKPMKVTDINSVMEGQNYAVIKNKKPDISEDDTMNCNGLSKGTKAWSDWWKKKRSN